MEIAMRTRVLVLIGMLFMSGAANGADRVDYLRQIKPIFTEKCYACHGAWKQKGKLRLETVSLIRKGGRNGPVIVPGKPGDSELIARVSAAEEDIVMPPPHEGERLSAEQLALVKRWIEEGAKGPEEPVPPDPREHWAFQPLRKPEIPINKKQISTNPIDAFLAAEWAKHGLVAEPPADRATLLRRVSIDLIGLPPTREELHAFLADSSPDAYEKVVDRLLASPRYGERWGRHWMDVWRYSDWSGETNNQVRGRPKHVWRWRDWIIESVNADKGYDRMILEMLAGDEVAPHDPQVLRATGFLARNYYKFNRNVWLDDAVEHTAKAFLGLTMGCAKCHDHKFDPVSQKDYYSLRAVFEPHQVRTDVVGRQRDVTKAGLVRVFDRDLATPTFVFHRGDENQPLRDNPLTPSVPEIFGVELKIQPQRVGPPPPALAAVAGLKAVRQPGESSGRRLALARWLTDAKNPLTARVAVNHIWLRHMGAPLVDDVADFGLRARRPRHAALLDWLAAELMNPSPGPSPESGGMEALTPPSLSGKGVGGLGSEGKGTGGLGSSPWSMKKLHRLIATSAAYRMRSEHRDNNAANLKIDPENKYLWRMNARRLEAEAIRDSVLAAAGNLDTKMGGPEISLTEGETSTRRAVYFRHAHERQVEFLKLYDAANPLECYRRAVTVVPHQALGLLNGPMVIEQSRLLAGTLAKENDDAFLLAAFETVLGRKPTADEVTLCREFLNEQAARLSDPAKLTSVPGGPASRTPPATDPAQRARENLVHVLFNHNEFVTVR